MIRLYKELYKHGVEMRVIPDYGVPDVVCILFVKEYLHYGFRFDLDHIESIRKSHVEILLDKLDYFLEEYETERKLVRKENA